MRLLLADIASGKTDLADILFLVAFIVFVVAAVVALMAKSFETLLIAAGLACASLGLLVL